MIKNFRHKGLEKFFVRGNTSGIQQQQARRIRLILARLHAATNPGDMDLPGLFLHKLKGKEIDRWSVSVSGSWRITFGFIHPDAIDIDYEDYH